MTLSYLRAIAEFCDRKFEFIPGVESFDLRLDEVRKELVEFDRVRGGTGKFCTFIFWQLKRSGYSPILWYVTDINRYEFFTISVYDYFISYYDGKIFMSNECPWIPLKKSENLREWENVDRNSFSNIIHTTEHDGCVNNTQSC